MKRKRFGLMLAILTAAVIGAILVFSRFADGSKLSCEAVVQETITMPGGETRLLVERTTKLYGSPYHALGIGKETRLLNAEGKTISVRDLKSGMHVQVSMKDTFIEETPYYYPIVYEIRIL